ncbi:family 2 glycosyl transferase [Clostridium manihotivorum]|uniref:Family 2 glycosyl transferase n=1 Tax=Clostridium manihotivorum TaxID=2320868 RepID=A0A410DPQ6_9CLOT|nr:family 2 glycosyl transferase [Clostridium manihotivorum]QAA31052.1 family 2 glycosyl transferase [Clostridium manihotivorum]
MKKFLSVIIALMIIILSIWKFGYIVRNKLSTYKEEDISFVSKVDSKNFYIYDIGKWKKQFVKGVNIGAAKPGTFPGELAITKEEYKRWFKYIGEMNADYVRVYTTLKPSFYEALYEYNRESIKPIYLFQGLWINEENISKIKNAEDSKIKLQAKEDIKALIDIIHGKAELPEKRGYASGVYKKDVSSYVAGWILGIEWDPDFVINTDEINTKGSSYEGKYLYTKGASPFEKFLCEIGDYAIDYETANYKMQRPTSFTNWVTTDMLAHPNEPLPKEDKVSVNTEHIKRKEAFKPGLFASYHIYPYYPDLMNYQHDYANYKDPDGKTNTYRAYLKDLIKKHTVPVLVAEFGIPASRGSAHVNIHMGFNQGDVDEKSQGEMNKFMLQNIYDEGYMGGLVFTWQDEWFKRTWNTMDLDIPERRAYWSNPQTNEQEFGVLAFDPGKKDSVCYVDGDPKEWEDSKLLAKGNDFSLYAKQDEKYLYLYAKIDNFNIDKDKFLIPIDVTDNSGSYTMKDTQVKFQRPVDFIVYIDGKSNSRVLVHSYYDAFYYLYAKQLNMIERNLEYEKKQNNIFNPIYLCLNKELFLPQDKITLPLSKYETGRLTFGDGNPKHDKYNSLTDFNVNGDNIEIRIPWQLINFMDPSTKKVMNDLYVNGISPKAVNGIYIGGIHIANNKNISSNEMGYFSWNNWNIPSYHERLKPSYYILKDAFKYIDQLIIVK